MLDKLNKTKWSWLPTLVINQYIYIYIYKQRPHAREHEVLPCGVLYEEN